MQNSTETWSGRRDEFDKFLNLHKSPLTGMAFRHSEKLKTCDWEEKCLKYMDRNMRWRLNDYANRETSQIQWLLETGFEVEIFGNVKTSCIGKTTLWEPAVRHANLKYWDLKDLETV